MILALLFLLAAPRPVVLVVPPALHGDAPAWASFGIAETITDLVAQQPDATWVSLKQLDAVLRRRDLRLAEAADPELALPLGRTLGATDVVVSDLRRVGERYYLSGQRLAIATRKVVKTFKVEGEDRDLPMMAATLSHALLGTSGPPLETDPAAFGLLSRCGLGLLRHPLRPQAGVVPPLDDAVQVEADCRGALHGEASSGEAHAALAVLLALKGQVPEALREVAAARGKRFVPLAALAESFAHRKAGDEPAARRALEQAAAARPGFLHALGYLAEERMEVLDYQGALAAWDKVLARAPDHPFALGQKGHALARLGRTREALATTRRALDLDPNDAELLIELASRQIDAGANRDAEATLRQALSIYPPRPLARLRLGFLYLKEKRVQDARDTLTEALTDAWREDEARTRGLAFADLARVAGLEGKLDEAVGFLAAARAEGAPEKLPCDEPELKAFRGNRDFEAACAAGGQ